METIVAPGRDAAAGGMLNWVEYAAMGVELLAVALIVGMILTDGVVCAKDLCAASRPKHL